MFTHIHFSIEEVPQFGSLVFGIPLTEFIAMGEEALFGTGFFFITAPAAEQCIEFVFFNGVKQGNGLQYVTAGVVAAFFNCTAFIDAFLYRSDHQPGSQFFNQVVSVFKGFFKVVAGVNVHQGERDFLRPEGFSGHMDHYDRVFTSREKEPRIFKLRSDFAHDENRFIFELPEVVQFKACHYVIFLLIHAIHIPGSCCSPTTICRRVHLRQGQPDGCRVRIRSKDSPGRAGCCMERDFVSHSR